VEFREWFLEWERHINACDYSSARSLFDPDVVGFGTYVGLLRGIDALEHEQWRAIWGNISNFRFDFDELITHESEDGSGWGICPWNSVGYDATGQAFARPGRATVLFNRDHASDRLLAVHTHISLAPGSPQTTHGSL
jgi:ketosteroid isomerase-like protein